MTSHLNCYRFAAVRFWGSDRLVSDPRILHRLPDIRVHVPPSPNHMFNFPADDPCSSDESNVESGEDPQEDPEEEPEEEP
ncbi:hypothetical protein Tco_1404190 [Tanacetum coccineum]